MTRRTILLVLVPFLGAVIVIALAATPVQSQKASQHTRWEYGEFKWKGTAYRWETEAVVHEANSMPELAVKLGRPTQKDFSTAILDVLGEQGWELVSHVALYKDGVREAYWTFKRPIVNKRLER